VTLVSIGPASVNVAGAKSPAGRELVTSMPTVAMRYGTSVGAAMETKAQAFESTLGPCPSKKTWLRILVMMSKN
jgi:hypothetical protein